MDVTKKNLPLYCPSLKTALWSAHPRIYLPLEKKKTVICPYCSEKYILVDD